MTRATISRDDLEHLSEQKRSLLKLALLPDPKTKKPLEDNGGNFELKPTVAMLLGKRSVTVLVTPTNKAPHYVFHEKALETEFNTLKTSLLNPEKALNAFTNLYNACEKSYGRTLRNPHLNIQNEHSSIKKERLNAWIQTINRDITEKEKTFHINDQHGENYLCRRSMRPLSAAWTQQEKVQTTQNKKRCQSLSAVCVSALIAIAAGVSLKLVADSPTFLITSTWQATLTANPGMLAASIVAAVAGSATLIALVFLLTHVRQRTKESPVRKKTPTQRARPTTYLTGPKP